MDSTEKNQSHQFTNIISSETDVRKSVNISSENKMLGYWRRGFILMSIVPFIAIFLFAYSHNNYPELIKDNPLLNGIIVIVFAIGQILFFYQLYIVRLSHKKFIHFISNIKNYKTNNLNTPEIISHTLNTLIDLDKQKKTSQLRKRNPEQILAYIIEGLISRIDNQRQLPKYIVSVLFLLGLVGTFIGLLATVIGVSDVIESLTWQGNNIEKALSKLNDGLTLPISGMKTAFSTSIIGLGGGLVSGLSVLILHLVQNKFINIVEYQLVSKDIISETLGSANFIENSEKEISKLTVGILKILVSNNEETINRMDTQNKKQLAWMTSQLNASSPVLDSILSNLLKRIDLVENILVKIADSINKSADQFPKKNIGIEINQSIEKLNNTISKLEIKKSNISFKNKNNFGNN